jgi:hypothetical protein
VEEPAAWHAAVDPDFISEAEEIANEIAVKKLSLQSLREGISQFVEIAEGPTVQPIETKRGNAERRLQRLYSVAQKEEIAQIKRGKLGQSPETLNPKLQSATEALRLEESELKATAADCTARVQACYKIIQSRESIAAVPVPKADVVTVKEENVEA